jgi:5-oxoprolinase (ATP-hydrolysing)
MTFLVPTTVTTLCSHRVVPPFGAKGGAEGMVGENAVMLPDGTRRVLRGNDEIELPAGSVFEMRTPGGGGWGKMG